MYFSDEAKARRAEMDQKVKDHWETRYQPGDGILNPGLSGFVINVPKGFVDNETREALDEFWEEIGFEYETVTDNGSPKGGELLHQFSWKKTNSSDEVFRVYLFEDLSVESIAPVGPR